MLSYVVLALNLAVYAVGIGIALTAGGEASNDYFLQLAKVNEDVLNGQYWRCAGLNPPRPRYGYTPKCLWLMPTICRQFDSVCIMQLGSPRLALAGETSSL